jgi:hypothetical protein
MLERIAEQWQQSLQKRFPSALLRPSRLVFQSEERPILDVFLLPDMHAFVRFMLTDEARFCGENKLPCADLIPHGIEDTIRYYPEVLKSIALEKNQAGLDGTSDSVATGVEALSTLSTFDQFPQINDAEAMRVNVLVGVKEATPFATADLRTMRDTFKCFETPHSDYAIAS